MPTAKPKRFSIEDFLALPEVRPAFEYFQGRVIQKMSPRLPHGVIQLELAMTMNLYARPQNLGRAFIELRSTFGGSSHVPDISFFTRDRQPSLKNPHDRERVLIAPDLAIEILSPGQTGGELARKLRSAIRRGVRLGWLIDDRHHAVHVYHPTRPPLILRAGDLLTGEDVLPGFVLPLDELFGWLTAD